ncbi:hypothetical protein Q1695_014792 [Nippostrongylus brasiliensis]|nr:hypothetical protein Q1695_014792 [Nippostrongylus brasiliensis]
MVAIDVFTEQDYSEVMSEEEIVEDGDSEQERLRAGDDDGWCGISHELFLIICAVILGVFILLDLIAYNHGKILPVLVGIAVIVFIGVGIALKNSCCMLGALISTIIMAIINLIQIIYALFYGRNNAFDLLITLIIGILIIIIDVLMIISENALREEY